MFSGAFRSAFGAVFGGALAGLVFLLRDDFTTDEAAPLASPRMCEPGPGTLTIRDTGNKAGISGGTLVYNGGAGTNDPYTIDNTGRTRVAGLAVMVSVSQSSDSSSWRVGFATASNARPTAPIVFVGGLGIFRVNTSAVIQIEAPFSANTTYLIALCLRTTGSFILIKGGVFTNWTLLWVDEITSTATLFPGVGDNQSNVAVKTHHWLKVIDLPANGYTVWSDDYGIATERYAGSVSAGQAFTHEANCLIEWTQTTLPSVSLTVVNFREQDTSNTWRVFINSTGEFTLQEMVAGVPTTRASVAGVIANGHRVVLIMDGTTIRGYSNNVLRWTYSSASAFQSETDGRVTNLGTSAVISDLISWPRTLSGEAADSLDAVVNA